MSETFSDVILRCEADDAFASLASLEGWLHALRRTTSFEARKGSHLRMTLEIASKLRSACDSDDIHHIQNGC